MTEIDTRIKKATDLLMNLISDTYGPNDGHGKHYFMLRYHHELQRQLVDGYPFIPSAHRRADCPD